MLSLASPNNFLKNELPDHIEEVFKECSSSSACTLSVSDRAFPVELGDYKYKLTLVDTMGFPDTDKARVVKFYDEVVMAVNKPLNMVLWVVKNERALPSVFQRHEVLMREFNKLNIPIVLVINNFGNFRRADPAKRNAAQQDCEDFGLEIKSKTHVAVAQIVVSTDFDALATSVKSQIARALVGTTMKSSQLQTLGEVRSQMEAATSEESQLAVALEARRTQLVKIEDDIHHQKNKLKEVMQVDRTTRGKYGSIMDPATDGKLLKRAIGLLDDDLVQMNREVVVYEGKHQSAIAQAKSYVENFRELGKALEVEL